MRFLKLSSHRTDLNSQTRYSLLEYLLYILQMLQMSFDYAESMLGVFRLFLYTTHDSFPEIHLAIVRL